MSNRAAVLTAPGEVEWRPVEPAELEPGQVRVQVDGCGICGSNVPVWQGRPWFGYPLPPGVPGHEGWGRVLEHGPDAGPAPPAGTRVAFLADNAFAETVAVPGGHLVELPENHGGPFPGEALGCAFNVAARSAFPAGRLVAVVGAGFLGLVVGALAASAGARVVALARRPCALEAASALGIQHTVRVADPADAAAAVTRLGDGPPEVVVEAAGTQETLDLAAQLVGPGGRLVIAGFHQDGLRTVDLCSWNLRAIELVNAHERDPAVRVAGIAAAAAAVAAGRLDPTPLWTHRYPMPRLGEALAAMVTRPAGFLKAVVER